MCRKLITVVVITLFFNLVLADDVLGKQTLYTEDYSEYFDDDDKTELTPVFIASGVVLLLFIGYFFFYKHGSSNQPESTPTGLLEQEKNTSFNEEFMLDEGSFLLKQHQQQGNCLNPPDEPALDKFFTQQYLLKEVSILRW